MKARGQFHSLSRFPEEAPLFALDPALAHKALPTVPPPPMVSPSPTQKLKICKNQEF
jgi:hypothetical protein